MRFASRVAAMHSALWHIDGGYRLWWHVWPVSIALLICGWIYLEKPAPQARSASDPSAVAKPFEKRSVIVWSEKLLGESRVCHDRTLRPDVIVEACSRIIESGLLDQWQLVAAYYQRGYYSAATQPDRALADYEAALKIQPDNADVLTDRGWIHMEHDRPAAGLADLTKAIGLLEYSRSSRARLYRASAYLMLKDFDKAAADLDESRKIDPTSPGLYLTRGDIELAQKHYDAALQAYDEFNRRVPGEAHGWIGRGLVLEATGHPNEALIAIESGLKLNPASSEALDARARLRATAAATPEGSRADEG